MFSCLSWVVFNNGVCLKPFLMMSQLAWIFSSACHQRCWATSELTNSLFKIAAVALMSQFHFQKQTSHSSNAIKREKKRDSFGLCSRGAAKTHAAAFGEEPFLTISSCESSPINFLAIKCIRIGINFPAVCVARCDSDRPICDACGANTKCAPAAAAGKSI